MRSMPGKPRPVQPGALWTMRLSRIVMRPGPPAPPGTGQRERVDHRAGARVLVEVVKPAQHALAMRGRGGAYQRPGTAFPVTGFRTRARAPPPPPGPAPGLVLTWIHRQKSRASARVA